MNEEIWKPISGFEGLYDVSSHGRVRSYRRRGSKKVHTTPVPLCATHCDSNGYPQMDLRDHVGRRKMRTVHKLVAETFLGPANGLEIDHLDSNRANPSLDNLEYVTSKENQSRSWLRGRKSHPNTISAVRSARRKLTDEQVKLIFERVRFGSEHTKTVAADFGVSDSAVKNIKHKRNWKHLLCL